MTTNEAPERIALRWEPGAAVTNGPLMTHPDYTRYIREDAAKPRVKPLEWEKWVDAHVKVFCAQTVIGRYKVQERANGAGWMLVFPNGNITNRDTEEAAKTAAQADYDARILSALVLP